MADEPAAQTAPDLMLRSIVAAMWDEYNKDQECDYVRINQLIEEGARALLETMTMDDLDALGEAHVDDPI